MAGIGARRSAFPVGKPHTAMRGAFALCDSPHTSMKVCPYTKTTLHEATRCRFSQTGLRPWRTTNNEHAITLTGAELNEVVGDCIRSRRLPSPAGAEPLDLQYLPEFRNQSALHLHERIPPVLVLIYGGPSSAPARPPRAGVNRNVGLEAGRFFPVPMPTK